MSSGNPNPLFQLTVPYTVPTGGLTLPNGITLLPGTTIKGSNGVPGAGQTFPTDSSPGSSSAPRFAGLVIISESNATYKAGLTHGGPFTGTPLTVDSQVFVQRLFGEIILLAGTILPVGTVLTKGWFTAPSVLQPTGTPYYCARSNYDLNEVPLTGDEKFDCRCGQDQKDCRCVKYCYIPPVLPTTPSTVYNVYETYGGNPNGTFDNSTAINNAITDAVNNPNGGIILLPFVDGTDNVYLSGPITFVGNNLNLQVQSGVTLKALPIYYPDPNGTVPEGFYPGTAPPFISGGNPDWHDLIINGGGIIDGNGHGWYAYYYNEPNGPNINRPNLIRIGPTNVLVENVTLSNPAAFHLQVTGSNITVRNVVSVAPTISPESPNTDGLDLAGSHILVENCFISVGDDFIAIAPEQLPATDILIKDCTFGTGHGVSIGSYTNYGLDNMTVKNCQWGGDPLAPIVGCSDCSVGIKIKSQPGRGGLMNNITYKDLVMRFIEFPILFYSYYDLDQTTLTPEAVRGIKGATTCPDAGYNACPQANDASPPVPPTYAPTPLGTFCPTIQNVLVKNLLATEATGFNMVYGLPSSLYLTNNIIFDNVNTSGRGFMGTFLYNTVAQFLNKNEVGEIQTVNSLVITEQPSSKCVKKGDSVALSVGTAGESGVNGIPPTFQWYKDCFPLSDGKQEDGSKVKGSKSHHLCIKDVKKTAVYSAQVNNKLDDYDTTGDCTPPNCLIPNSYPVSASSALALVKVKKC